jgi:hypothetical protein
VSYNAYDQMSIFGRTYGGVPSPLVPHRHPYPTRYHGYVSSVPRFGQTYKRSSYLMPGVWSWPTVARPEAMSIVRKWTEVGPPPPISISGIGQVREELCGLGEPVLCASTGSTMVDALVGAGIGYLAAPKKEHAAYWAAAGAAGAALAGALGILVVGAAGLYKRGSR